MCLLAVRNYFHSSLIYAEILTDKHFFFPFLFSCGYILWNKADIILGIFMKSYLIFFPLTHFVWSPWHLQEQISQRRPYWSCSHWTEMVCGGFGLFFPGADIKLFSFIPSQVQEEKDNRSCIFFVFPWVSWQHAAPVHPLRWQCHHCVSQSKI